MNRRGYLSAVGGTTASLAIAGCADETGEPDPDPEEEPDVDDGDDPQPDDDPGDDGLEESNDDPVLELLDVDAAATVEQGKTLEVTVTLETNPPAAVSATLEADGDVLAEDTGRVDDGEQSLTLELEIPDDVAGEKTLEVEADNGEETATESKSVEIVDAIEPWESRLQEGIAYIEEFLQTYADTAEGVENPTFIDVTATTPEFNWVDVSDASTEARTQLRDARDITEPASDARDLVDEYRDENDALRSMVQAQDDVCTIFEELEGLWELYDDGRDYSRDADEARADAEDSIDEVEEEFDELQEYHVRDDYEKKFEQWSAEVAAMDRAIGGINYLFSARNAAEEEFWALANDYASDARRDLDDALRQIDQESDYPPEDRVDETLVEHIEEWRDEADSIERTSAGRAESD